MKQRYDDLLDKQFKEKVKEKTNKTLFKNIRSVDTYNHGTTGYKIKEGSNKDKVLAHIKLPAKEI